MLPALLLAASGGWVTKMQSLYGVQASEAARVWAGEVNDTASHVYSTMGYYWHAPREFDSNRGLGCGTPTRRSHAAPRQCTPWHTSR
eukprot:scaffold80198_cov73-Phaeocystis_antarctica.AAC.10